MRANSKMSPAHLYGPPEIIENRVRPLVERSFKEPSGRVTQCFREQVS